MPFDFEGACLEMTENGSLPQVSAIQASESLAKHAIMAGCRAPICWQSANSQTRSHCVTSCDGSPVNSPCYTAPESVLCRSSHRLNPICRSHCPQRPAEVSHVYPTPFLARGGPPSLRSVDDLGREPFTRGHASLNRGDVRKTIATAHGTLRITGARQESSPGWESSQPTSGEPPPSLSPEGCRS
jgi:hypothetical protein